MSSEFIFTDEEIRGQLKLLGFGDVEDEQLRAFKIELQRLVQEEVEGTQNQLPDQLRLSTEEKDGWYPPNGDVELKFLNADAPTYLKSNHVLIEKLPRIHHDRNAKSNWILPTFVDYRKENLPSSLNNSVYSSRSSIVSGMSCAESNGTSTPSSVKDSSSEVSAVPIPRTRKRKVFRKRNGVSYISNETTCSSNASSVNGSYRRSSVPGKASVRSRSLARNGLERTKLLTDIAHFCKKWKSTSDLTTENDHIHKQQSVVLPYSKKLQTKSYLKTDPVALYHYYKKEWANHNIPGERDHRELRWNIRTMMSLKDGSTV